MQTIAGEAVMPAFAAVRCARISDLANLNRIALHGQRMDPNSQKRVDPKRTMLNLAHSAYSEDALDLIVAFKTRKKSAGASEYGKAAIGLHVLLVISPDIVKSAGDPHDPQNPINQTLFEQGQAWAEQEFGAGSVIAARLDLDEAGSGVLDLVLVPVRRVKVNKTREKTIISVRQALQDIQARHKTSRSYIGLQDSWAAFASRHIDRRLQRGVPKTQTARTHIHADVYREEAVALNEAIEVGVAAVLSGDLVRVNRDIEPGCLADQFGGESPIEWRRGKDAADDERLDDQNAKIIRCWSHVSAPLAALAEIKAQIATDAAAERKKAHEEGLAAGREEAEREARQKSEALDVGVRSIVEGDLVHVHNWQMNHLLYVGEPRIWREEMDVAERDQRDSLLEQSWDHVSSPLVMLADAKAQIEKDAAVQRKKAHEEGLAAGRAEADREAQQTSDAFEVGVRSIIEGALIDVDINYHPNHYMMSGDEEPRTWREDMDAAERDRRDSVIARSWERVKLALAYLLQGKAKLRSITSIERAKVHEQGLIAGQRKAEAAFETGFHAFLAGHLNPLPPPEDGNIVFDISHSPEPEKGRDALKQAISPVFAPLHRILWKAKQLLPGFAPEAPEALRKQLEEEPSPSADFNSSGPSIR
jgi:hypothetical protein